MSNKIKMESICDITDTETKHFLDYIANRFQLEHAVQSEYTVNKDVFCGTITYIFKNKKTKKKKASTKKKRK